MKFDIDVSGGDIFEPNYCICVANDDGIIKGFKMTEKLIRVLTARYGQGLYRYSTSKKQNVTFKVRIYCIIVHLLLDQIKTDTLSLRICRDFNGREEDIKTNLNYFLEKIQTKQTTMRFERLGKESAADKYAYLMRKDTKNKLNTYVKITIKQLEEYLK